MEKVKVKVLGVITVKSLTVLLLETKVSSLGLPTSFCFCTAFCVPLTLTLLFSLVLNILRLTISVNLVRREFSITISVNTKNYLTS